MRKIANCCIYPCADLILPIIWLIQLTPRFILAFNNILSRFAFLVASGSNKISSNYNARVRVKGRDVVAVRLMVHSTVLLSFGLADPLLIIPIVFAMVLGCVTCQAMVGKTLYAKDMEVEASEVQDEIVGGEDHTIMNPIALTIDESAGHADAAATLSDDRAFLIQADLLMMEHLDMTSSWRAVDECFH
jgi:hypothetical protein